VKLEPGTGRSIEDPSASQIASELAALAGGVDSFAILSHDELTYIQTAGGPSEGLILEYQQGSTDQHFRSARNDLPISTVTRAFQLYAEHDSSWRSVAAWERDDIAQPANVPLPVIFAVVVALILLLVFWFHRSVS
jgi:hypothetical protein